MHTILKAYTLSECMEIMAERIAKCEANGENNLVFCEDRLTLIAERALLRRLGGTFQTSVTTFARFLSTEERTISKQGSVMAVGEVMTRLQRENALGCFTSTTGVGNNAKCIYETIAQFSASEITPEILKESAAQLPDDVLRKKTTDLAAIYEGYTAFLKERAFLDESRYLSLLPARIRADKTLKNTNVFFLCYGSFTSQAAQTVRAALETAKNVFGIFCAGDEDFYVSRGYQTFLRVCKEYGTPVIEELGTPLDGDAERLRQSLFNPERVGKERQTTEKIRFYEGEDKVDEAEYVAVQIRRLTMENPTMRYRDFAILLPSVEGYSLSLKRALGEYGIPYFIDEKKSLKRHPLSRFLLDCFRVVGEKYAPAAVQSLAQNFFFGESGEYRNYLLKFANYRGGAKREIKTGEAVTGLFDLEKLAFGRERLLLATSGIKTRGKGKEYCFAVRKILSDFDVKNKLEALEERVDDVSQKGYLSQIYGALEKVLSEAELLTGEKEMTIVEFSAVLKDGLDATEISLIPLKADAVFIGDITDSRIEKVAVLFAMGMTDDVPRNASDTAIVSDGEIARLAQVKTLLEPTVAEVNLRGRESVCLNLCTFLKELHLSYPLSADGSEPTISDVFRYIDAVFCGLDGKNIQRQKGLIESEFKYKCSAAAPAVRQLLLEKNDYENSKLSSKGKDNRKFSSLYSALDKLSVQEKDDYLMEYEGQVRLKRGGELRFHAGKISPTSLEGYFACPFRHFVERGLKLKEREETAVLAVDTGNFIHELLETTVKRAGEIDTEEEMRAYAMQVGEEILKRPVYAAQSDTASGTFFGEKLLKEGADVVLAAYRQIKGSEFTVEETEKSVSTDTYHGKVDRMDGTDKYVRVIDYKTGAIDDSATSYYTGRKLQMQLYMSALKGERIPAGVFYFPASVAYSDGEEGRFQMKGFLNGDEDALRAGDRTISEEKQSEYFPASLKNSRSKRVMDESTFRDFLDYSVHVARQGCQELKEGFVAATPYGNSCDYCKYGGMCGFQKDAQTKRTEANIDPTAIAEIARTLREGKEKSDE